MAKRKDRKADGRTRGRAPLPSRPAVGVRVRGATPPKPSVAQAVDELGSTRRKLFVFEYLKDRNGAQAAIRAGYSSKTARAIASELLTFPDVRAAVDAQLEVLTESTAVSLERVVLELHRILLVDPAWAVTEDGALRPLREIPVDLRRAISSMEIEELWEKTGDGAEQIGVLKKIKFWSKTEASSQLLRTLGAFKDRVEHSADESLEALLRASVPELRE